MEIGGFCTLLFAVGLVALVASCLEVIAFAKVAQATDGSGLDAQTSPVNALAVARAALAVGTMSLLATAVFTFLDLAGMIVLRSRLWRQVADVHGMDWWSPPPTKPARPGDVHWQQGKAHRYKASLRHRTGSWWRRYMRLEYLAAAIRRRMAFVRLVAAVVLSLASSSIVVQLAVVSLTGRCQPVRDGARLVAASGAAQQTCHLVHKGTIAAVAVWACWTLLATILVFLNTHAAYVRPRPLDGGFSGIPLNIFGCDPPVRQPAAAPASSGKPPVAAMGQPAACLPAQSHYCTGSGHHPPPPAPKQPAHQRFSVAMGAASAGQKRMAGKHFRSSWSHIDEDSIISEPGRSDSQSLFQPQSKTHLFLHSQTMLQQFYNLQNQQLQGMQPYIPQPPMQPPHVSKDQMPGHKQPPLQRTGPSNPVRRRVQSVFYQSVQSPEPAVPELPEADAAATVRGRDEQGQQQQQQASLSQGPAGRTTAMHGMVLDADHAAYPFSVETPCAKSAGGHFGKRNTIG
ncbi:hypothetical protein H4R19_002564 [Coemansia spiralis]|nr:hypothetical protein H4R19_002564 [Coemansia spiralis]